MNLENLEEQQQQEVQQDVVANVGEDEVAEANVVVEDANAAAGDVEDEGDDDDISNVGSAYSFEDELITAIERNKRPEKKKKTAAVAVKMPPKKKTAAKKTAAKKSAAGKKSVSQAQIRKAIADELRARFGGKRKGGKKH
jgi:hypothetical protein